MLSRDIKFGGGYLINLSSELIIPRPCSHLPCWIHHTQTKVLVRKSHEWEDWRRHPSSLACHISQPNILGVSATQIFSLKKCVNYQVSWTSWLWWQKAVGPLHSWMRGLRVRPHLLGVHHDHGVGPCLREELVEDVGQASVVHRLVWAAQGWSQLSQCLPVWLTHKLC